MLRRIWSAAADWVGINPWRLALVVGGLVLAGSPAARRIVRPALVGAVRTGMVVTDAVRGATGGVLSGWRALVEEVRAERVASMAAVAGAAAGAAATAARVELQRRDLDEDQGDYGGTGEGDAGAEEPAAPRRVRVRRSGKKPR